MRSGAAVVPILALAFAGCVPDKGVRIAGTTSASIAVGARYRFAVIDLCEYSGPGFILIGPAVPLIIPTPPACLSTEVDSIVSVTFTDPAVFGVTDSNVDQGAALFEVQALRAGTTGFTITIETSTGTEYSASGMFTAEAVDHVDFAGDCYGLPGASDELVPVDREVAYRPLLYTASGAALAGFGYAPFLLDGEPLALTADNRFILPARAQTGEAIVTSPLDAAFAKPLRYVDATSFDGVAFLPVRDVIETAEGDLYLPIAATLGGEHPCVDVFSRRVVVETPAACGVHDMGVSDPPPPIVPELPSTPGAVKVRGLVRDTTCRVRAEVVGGTATGAIDLPVREGWTLQSPPSELRYAHGVSVGPEHVVLVGTRNSGTGSEPLLVAAVAEWDGATWATALPSIPANATNEGTLDGVAVAGTTVFAVGSQGAILRRVGAGAWTLMPSATTADLLAVHAISATEAYAVGDAGAVVRLAGGSWESVATGATAPLEAVWAATATDVYVAGDTELLHFDGAGWTPIDLAPLAPMAISFRPGWKAVWGSGPDDVYVGGVGPTLALAHWDGTAWSLARQERGLGIWGSGPDDVHVTGTNGFGDISHWDGATWTDRDIVMNFTIDVWGWSTREVYVLPYSDVLRRYR